MGQIIIISVFIVSLLLLIFLTSEAKNIQIITTMPTITPLSPAPTPQVSTIGQNTSLNSFSYPHSTEVSGNEGLVLQSTDDPRVITDWYKNAILSHNLKTTSFIQTNTNGEVFNQLVGANGNSQVRVEISKQAGQDTVTIKVNQ